MSDFEVLGYLKGHGLEVHQAAGKELTLQCIFCGEQHRKGKLYVNSESGAFSCKVCGEAGGLRALLAHFGEEIEQDSPAFRPSRTLQINEEYLELAERALWNNVEILDYLRDRGLSDENIRAARFGYHPPGWSLVDSLPNVGRPGGYTRAEIRETGLLNDRGDEFLTGKIIIPYISNRRIVQLRGKDPKGKYVTTPGGHVMLYNQDALRGAETAILVEGEFDTRILEAALHTAPEVRARRMAVVGLAGAESLPDGRQGFPAYFEDLKRVYVALDPDETGRRAGLKIRDLLGAKARVVEIPDPADWTDWLAPVSPGRPHGGHGWADAMRLITEADMRDKRVFSVSEAALKLRQIESGAPGIKLGWPSLDDLIKPGLRPGSVTIPLARTGVGKSIWLSQIAYNNRHVPTLFVTLELTSAETWNRLRRQARFFHPEFSEHQIEGLFPNLRMVDDNAVRPEEFAVLVEEFAEEVGTSPGLIFVDYLGYYARSQRGRDQYERVTNAVMDLKRIAKETEAALIVPSQVNRGAKPGEPIDEDDARDAGAVEETADFLFGIYRPWEVAQAGSVAGQVGSELKCKILKSRHGNKGRTAALAMSHASLAIVDQTDRRLATQVDLENAAINRGNTYEEIYRKQRQAALATLQGRLDDPEEPFTED